MMCNKVNYEDLVKEILNALQLEVGKDVNEHAISKINNLIKDRVILNIQKSLPARILRVWRYCIKGTNCEIPFEEINTIESNAWKVLYKEYEDNLFKESPISENVDKKFIDFKNYVLEKEKEGKIVIMTWDGVKEANIDDFINQPTEGLLYDLNRDISTILSYIEDPKWVNDYACMLVINRLMKINKELEKKHE